MTGIAPNSTLRETGGARINFLGKYDRLLFRAVHEELAAWGRWHESHADFTGYPIANILESYIGSSGGGLPGHRVLMLDMPPGIWATHHRVLSLSQSLQDVLNAWYVIVTREDGRLWKAGEKAAKLGITEVNFRQRLHRAKCKIAGIVVENLQNLSQVNRVRPTLTELSFAVGA